MTKLIWVIRRIRYIIKTTKYIIVIFTNHFVNIFIVKQITFANNNINNLNLRLIRVSIYLSQFRLDIKYKFSKKHVIFDVLSRFSSNNELVVAQFNLRNILDLNIYYDKIINSFCSKQIDNIYVLQKLLIIMSNDFRQRVIIDYNKKKIWQNLLIMLKNFIKRRTQKLMTSKSIVVKSIIESSKK